MKNRGILEEGTRYKKHCTQDNDASVHFKVGTLGPHTSLPIFISCPTVFSWISLMVWNLFPFKGGFSLRKSRSHRAPNLGYKGAESPEWFWYFVKNLCPRCDAWTGTLSWWSCQSPVAHKCGLLNHPNSFCGGMFKFNTKSGADSLMYLLSHFECETTQYTCSLNGVYCPHWLVQWSCHCSHMHIPAHCPWLPGYMDAAQTILVILAMVGFFQIDLVYRTPVTQ